MLVKIFLTLTIISQIESLPLESLFADDDVTEGPIELIPTILPPILYNLPNEGLRNWLKGRQIDHVYVVEQDINEPITKDKIKKLVNRVHPVPYADEDTTEIGPTISPEPVPYLQATAEDTVIILPDGTVIITDGPVIILSKPEPELYLTDGWNLDGPILIIRSTKEI